MRVKINLPKCKDYSNPLNCSIAKGLRGKLIFALVSPTDFHDLFLGFIPVWGYIPCETNKIAHQSTKENYKKQIGFVDFFSNKKDK